MLSLVMVLPVSFERDHDQTYDTKRTRLIAIGRIPDWEPPCPGRQVGDGHRDRSLDASRRVAGFRDHDKQEF